MLKLDMLLWMDLVITGYWLLSVGYLALFAAMGYFWLRKEKEIMQIVPQPHISLVIAIRNEAANLPALFRHLHQLSYPKVEVLLVNDHSEDESLQRLQQAVQEALAAGKDWQLLASTGIGKKAAISTALAVAKGEIIVTTDADCTFGKDWLEKLTAAFADENTQLVAGPVMTSTHPLYFFNAFQQVEWTSILLVTRLGFSIGLPFMCSAANMAYRKSAFDQVNGYVGNGQFLSGDDEFLLKKINEAYGKEAVQYVHKPQLLVTTKPQESWNAFLSQRARWASKWRRHDLGHLFVAAFPFLMLLCFLLSPSLLFLGSEAQLAFAGLWVIKILSEYLVVSKVLHQFSIKLSLAGMAVSSFIHPLYALATSLNMVNQNWEWKGRQQQPS